MVKTRKRFKRVIPGSNGTILELTDNRWIQICPTTSYFQNGHIVIETLRTTYYN